MDNKSEQANNKRFIAVMVALLLVISSVGYIVYRTLSNKAHDEKWKDYDECGLF